MNKIQNWLKDVREVWFFTKGYFISHYFGKNYLLTQRIPTVHEYSYHATQYCFYVRDFDGEVTTRSDMVWALDTHGNLNTVIKENYITRF